MHDRASVEARDPRPMAAMLGRDGGMIEFFRLAAVVSTRCSKNCGMVLMSDGSGMLAANGIPARTRANHVDSI